MPWLLMMLVPLKLIYDVTTDRPTSAPPPLQTAWLSSDRLVQRPNFYLTHHTYDTFITIITVGHRLFFYHVPFEIIGRIAQSVQRHATGWTVRGLNPGGGWELTHPPRPVLEPTQLPVPWVTRVKRPWRGVNNPPHLGPKSRREYSYTSTSSLSFHSLF
jgi:hypothetical protein